MEKFHLTPLPPPIDYEPLIRVLGEAHYALGELNGLLRRNILNPALFSLPLLTKEAVLSSRIEGTQATLEDVFEYEASEPVKSAAGENQEIIEIINYRRAMNFAIDELKTKNITGQMIKKIHYLLLESGRGSQKDRGSFRQSRVYIGPPGAPISEASYIPPEPGDIGALLQNWEDFAASRSQKDVLVQGAAMHYQFEAIHPFRDGNGRVGRLLIPLFLYKNEILSQPLLFISEYFERNRRDYYSYLRGVTENGDWNGWIKFFLLSLIAQAGKTRVAVEKIEELHSRLRQKISAANSVYAQELLDCLFLSPAVTFSKIKDKLKTKNPQTIYNLIEKFIALGILIEEPGRKRNRVFAFKELLEILK